MKLEDFCNAIKFKFVEKEKQTSEYVQDRISPQHEIVNTILPEENNNTERLKNLVVINKMSTYANGCIVTTPTSKERWLLGI